jgi:hypothetical protein
LSSVSGKTPLEPFFDSIKFLMLLFDSIEKQIMKIKDLDKLKQIMFNDEDDQSNSQKKKLYKPQKIQKSI